MADQKKLWPEFRIYASEDLSRQWFVYWYEHGRRRKKIAGINRSDTFAGRMAAAKALVAELRRSHEPASAPLRDRVNEWLAGKRNVWKVKTWQSYKSVADVFFRWTAGRAVTAGVVDEFFLALARERSGTTYNNYRHKLTQMLASVGEGETAKGIGPVKAVKTPARYFQAHQVKVLKEYISREDPALWRFIQFIFYCFIRPGELRLIRAGDVFLEENKIMVKGEISKNRKTQFVAIPSAFRKDVDWVKDLRPGDFLFRGHLDASKPVGMNTMSRRHREVLKALGFSDEYKLYSWKHTGAVMAVMAGVTIKELQMQLRHHSLDQVNEYLRQMGVQDMVSIMERFPAL